MGIEQREGVREGAEKGRRGWNVNILETAANSALLSSPPQAKEALRPRPVAIPDGQAGGSATCPAEASCL